MLASLCKTLVIYDDISPPALAVLNCCVIETKWQFLDFDAYPLESTRTLLLFCSMLCTTISPSCVIYVAGSNILSFYMDLITNIMHGLFGFCLIIYMYILFGCYLGTPSFLTLFFLFFSPNIFKRVLFFTLISCLYSGLGFFF